MAITYQGKVEGGGAATSYVDIVLHATILPGDALVASFSSSVGRDIASVPAGWTLVANGQLAYKIADGTEDGTTVRFNFTGTAYHYVRVLRATAASGSFICTNAASFDNTSGAGTTSCSSGTVVSRSFCVAACFTNDPTSRSITIADGTGASAGGFGVVGGGSDRLEYVEVISGVLPGSFTTSSSAYTYFAAALVLQDAVVTTSTWTKVQSAVKQTAFGGSVTLGAAPTAGNLLVAIANESPADTLSALPGWTKNGLLMAWKIADGTEGTNIQVIDGLPSGSIFVGEFAASGAISYTGTGVSTSAVAGPHLIVSLPVSPFSETLVIGLTGTYFGYDTNDPGAPDFGMTATGVVSSSPYDARFYYRSVSAGGAITIAANTGGDGFPCIENMFSFTVIPPNTYDPLFAGSL